MTRFPILSTLLALIPLIALAFPLAKILNAQPHQNSSPLPPETAPTNHRQTYLSLASSHPFEEITISQDSVSHTFKQGEDALDAPLKLNPDGHSLTLQINVRWPEGTPEAAARFEISPEHLDTKTITLWGTQQAFEEITLTWDSPSP